MSISFPRRTPHPPQRRFVAGVVCTTSILLVFWALSQGKLPSDSRHDLVVMGLIGIVLLSAIVVACAIYGLRRDDA